MQMSDDEKFGFSPWDATIIDLDNALWNTEAFWEPLDEEHAQFTSKQA
jgi:hypothetical protein